MEINMKNNKLKLVYAILYMISSICFILAAVFYTTTQSKVLSCVAGLFMLIGSIGLFSGYVKNRKSEKNIGKDAESLE